MKKFSFLLLSIFLLVACGGSSLKAGDAVLADWYKDNWHRTKLVEECKNEKGREGWKVDFEDDFYDAEKGDPAVCYEMARIVLNVAPEAGEVRVGDKVLAVSGEVGGFYSAEVLKVEGEKYIVKFELDGYEGEVELKDLRAIAKE